MEHGLSWGLVPVCVVPASCVPYVYATALFYTAGEIPCSFTITVKIYQSRSPIRDRCTRPHTESHLNACLEALALSLINAVESLPSVTPSHHYNSPDVSTKHTLSHTRTKPERASTLLEPRLSFGCSMDFAPLIGCHGYLTRRNDVPLISPLKVSILSGYPKALLILYLVVPTSSL